MESSGQSRKSARRIWISSASVSLSSRSKFTTRNQYKNPVARRTSAKAEPAYQAVRRAARDHGRDVGGLPSAGSRAESRTFFKDIAYSADRMDQLPFEGVIHLSAEAAHLHVHDIRVTVEVHVPDLFGNQGTREYLARAPCEQRQEGEFFRCQVQTRAPTHSLVPQQVKFQVC